MLVTLLHLRRDPTIVGSEPFAIAENLASRSSTLLRSSTAHWPTSTAGFIADVLVPRLVSTTAAAEIVAKLVTMLA